MEKADSINVQTERKIVDDSNFKTVFIEFLESFEDKSSESPKYMTRLKEMVNNNNNNLHISRKDMKRFNPTLADFVFRKIINLYSDICSILKRFVEERHLVESKQDIFFSLVK